jgi:hypothetical protein
LFKNIITILYYKVKLEIYEVLQERVDKMSVGYPKTTSGVQIKLLKELFTLEEAFLPIKLNFFPP